MMTLYEFFKEAGVRKLLNNITTPDSGKNTQNLEIIKYGIVARLSNEDQVKAIKAIFSTIPDLLNYLYKVPFYLFANCDWLTEIHIPSNIKLISEYAFFKCKNLKNVTFDEGVKILQASAFRDCTNLTSIELPNSVEQIESFALYGCSTLNTIKIGPNVEYISNNALDATTPMTIYSRSTEVAKNVANNLNHNIHLICN